MPPPRTLRRKLQKKKKHRVYGKCPQCGGGTERKVKFGPRLFQLCGCGWSKELFWSGGGTVDTYASS